MNISFFRSSWFVKISALMFTAALLYSCDPENEEAKPVKGSIEFSFVEKSASGGRTKATATAFGVTIKDATGNIIYNKKRLEILKFGNEYISVPLELKVGNYTLTEFFVVDENNKTISATPLEGSDLAYLVNDPAPISFSV